METGAAGLMSALWGVAAAAEAASSLRRAHEEHERLVSLNREEGFARGWGGWSAPTPRVWRVCGDLGDRAARPGPGGH